MDHISHKMKQDIPKGASNKVDLIAAQIIDKHGIETLDMISKIILKIEKSPKFSD